MQKWFDVIERLVSKGGPHETDDPMFEAWLNQVGSEIRCGKLSTQEMQSLRNAFGEALSARTLQGFALAKPYGYAGDFGMLEKIYLRQVSDESHLRKWDEYFHRTKATKAVRNRKVYFINLLRKLDTPPRGKWLLKC